MAHPTPLPAAPAPTAGAKPLPDVFDERTHRRAHWALPAVLGLVYGYWAAAINRDAGPITGWNVLFGFVSAFAFMGLYLAVGAIAPKLRREPHAALWGSFAGVAFGFIYSQAGKSVLHCTLMALAVAVPVGAVAFYRYYTHEDATGHRLR
jgi:hypothetical protein